MKKGNIAILVETTNVMNLHMEIAQQDMVVTKNKTKQIT